MEVLRHSGQNELFYYCHIFPEPGTDYNYTILWFVSHEKSPRTEIEQFDSMKYDENFRNMTAITESMLRNNGVKAFPYVVSNGVHLHYMAQFNQQNRYRYFYEMTDQVQVNTYLDSTTKGF